MSEYYGLTHLYLPNFIFGIWAKFLCVKNIHLFDEVQSGDENYLVCDSCQLCVMFHSIDISYVDKKHLPKASQ
jgi:hypothetical protein